MILYCWHFAWFDFLLLNIPFLYLKLFVSQDINLCSLLVPVIEISYRMILSYIMILNLNSQSQYEWYSLDKANHTCIQYIRRCYSADFGEIYWMDLYLALFLGAYRFIAIMTTWYDLLDLKFTLHKKWSFALRISSVNVTKSAVSCEFSLIYWRIP